MEEAHMTRNDISALIKEMLAPVMEDVKKGAAIRDNLNVRSQLGGEQTSTKTAASAQMGNTVSGFIKALVMAEKNRESPLNFATRVFGDKAEVTKALSANQDVSGGFLVPEVLSTEIIEFLRPASVMRSMGARVLPLNNLQMSIPKVTGGANATYVGENINIQATEQSFGQITLAAKKLAALVPISNELLQVNTIAADQIVREDLVKAMAQREDQAFMRGDGTVNTPKGLLNWISPTNVFAATQPAAQTGTPTYSSLQSVTNDLATCILKLRQANIPMTNCGWIFAPQIEYYLMTIRDSLGNYAFQPEMATGKLLRFPYAVTTQIPTNLTDSTTGSPVSNCSEIYFVNFDDAFIGDSMQVRIDVSNTAAYYDGMNVVATFSEDQTVIRAVSMHDFAMRYDLAGAVMKSVKGWGAA